MALIKVRATAKGFIGGLNTKLKGIWACPPKKASQAIPDEQRGLMEMGQIFMVEESKFTDAWMEEVETAINPEGKEYVVRVVDRSAKHQEPVAATAITDRVDLAPGVTYGVEATGAKRGPGRPKKVQP